MTRTGSTHARAARRGSVSAAALIALAGIAAPAGPAAAETTLRIGAVLAPKDRWGRGWRKPRRM